MNTRKITCKPDSSKVQAFIHCLQNNTYYPSCSEAQLLAQSSTLNQYFYNLHHLITPENLYPVKKYQILPDGIYLILKGQISFMFNSSENQKEMMRTTKGGQGKGSSRTILLSQLLTVFECTFKNCTALEQSQLLRIEEDQVVSSKFYQFYNRRKDLYDNHYLPSHHYQQKKLVQSQINLANQFPTQRFGSVFSLDHKIHSSFLFKKYVFRQILAFPSIAIISDGRARTKDGSSHYIQKYGVFLPNVEYEVTSAQLEIMLICMNQSVNLNIDFEKIKDSEKDRESQKRETCTNFPLLRKKTKLLTFKGKQNSISVNKDRDIFQSSRIEGIKREKDLTKLSKQSQNYSIISSFLCNKSLDLIHKQSLAVKNKKEQKCKNPLVLFNIVNQKSKIATPHFGNATPVGSVNIKEKTREKKNVEEGREIIKSGSNHGLLRKLRLPLKDFERMQRRQGYQDNERDQSGGQREKNTKLRTDSKAKSLFVLTSGKPFFDRSEEEAFVRYENQE